MMKFWKLRISVVQICLVLFCSLIQQGGAFSQGIAINEVSADNETIIADEDGDYSDWIELYNNSSEPLNIFGYKLSDDLSQPDQWAFPDFEIPAHGFLIVFASGKNRINGEFHTNFSISADGEPIVLTDPEGLIADQVTVNQVQDDEVFGRLPDGGSNWFELSNPTPAESNELNEILLISHSSGFYTSPLTLSIESVLGDTVHYTTNGDDPTPASETISEPLELGFTYGIPNDLCNIPTTADESLIGEHAWQIPSSSVDKAHVLRFATFRDGQRTSDIYTKTFFVDSTGKQTELPVFSIVTPERNLFDYNSGIYTPGVNFDITNPVWTGNFFERGSQWERPAHINFFDEDGNMGLEQDAGIRIHGFKTRGKAQKSLRLYARNEYGEKYFNYPLLPQRDLDKYKRVLLRATMGSWFEQSIVKDAVAHQIARNLDIEYQEYQPAVVYINGEYWGIHTIRDRIDERYVEYTTGVDKDSVEFINGPSLDLFEIAQQNDLSTEEGYSLIESKLDIDNFIDYYIAEMFFGNYDWIANNWELWRPKTNGKWRSVFFDLDAGLNDASQNMFEFCSNETEGGHPQPEYTSLFRGLIENDEFRRKFAFRYGTLLNNEFGRDRMDSILQSMKEQYAGEIQRHLERWNYPDSYADWENDIDEGLTSFLNDRPCIVSKNLKEFFDIYRYGFTCDRSGGLEDPDYQGVLLLSPNPTSGLLGIINVSEKEIRGRLQLYSLEGQIIKDRVGVKIEVGERIYLDLSNNPNGLYLLKLRTKDFDVIKRVVIAEAQ